MMVIAKFILAVASVVASKGLWNRSIRSYSLKWERKDFDIYSFYIFKIFLLILFFIIFCLFLLSKICIHASFKMHKDNKEFTCVGEEIIVIICVNIPIHRGYIWLCICDNFRIIKDWSQCVSLLRWKRCHSCCKWCWSHCTDDVWSFSEKGKKQKGI